MKAPEPSNVIVGVVLAVVSSYATTVWQNARDVATQGARLDSNAECRAQLIEARNRENACRDRMHDRDIDDLRERIRPLERPTQQP